MAKRKAYATSRCVRGSQGPGVSVTSATPGPGVGVSATSLDRSGAAYKSTGVGRE
jgi:hypothetical protein